jgi:DNA-binding transcriptional ArsR family regulator
MRELAEVFKALADETRLEILTLLLIGGELCVCDVEGALGITQSKASRHLRYLRSAGLVANRREGVWMHYLVPDDLDGPRREVLRAAGKVIGSRHKAALEQRLSEWLQRKQHSDIVCTTA